MKTGDLIVSSSLGFNYFSDLLREHNTKKLQIKKELAG